MNQEKDRSVSTQLHPRVYMAIVGLALWLVVSMWGFADDGYTDYLLVVVSAFIALAVGLPVLLWWRVSRKWKVPSSDEGETQSFRNWAAGQFDTWQDRLSARNAMVEILLPFAAVAFGMTAFAIVLHFIAHAAA